MALEEWPPDDDATAEPWTSFVRARRHLLAGDADLAIREWAHVAIFDGWEPRHRLQAWTYLRAQGIRPDERISRTVLGVVAEVPMGDGHDVLAVYADGSIRFLPRDGGAVVVDSARYDLMLGVRSVLEVAQQLADQLGPWDGPEIPAVNLGQTRFTMLTAGGPVVGEGTDADLCDDPLAGPLFAAATSLLAATLGQGPIPPPTR